MEFDKILCEAIDKMIMHFNSNKDTVGLNLYLHQMNEMDDGPDTFRSWFDYSIIFNKTSNIMFILDKGLSGKLPCPSYSIVKKAVLYPAIWYYLIKTVCINYRNKELTDDLYNMIAPVYYYISYIYDETEIPYSVIKDIVNIGLVFGNYMCDCLVREDSKTVFESPEIHIYYCDDFYLREYNLKKFMNKLMI